MPQPLGTHDPKKDTGVVCVGARGALSPRRPSLTCWLLAQRQRQLQPATRAGIAHSQLSSRPAQAFSLLLRPPQQSVTGPVYSSGFREKGSSETS